MISFLIRNKLFFFSGGSPVGGAGKEKVILVKKNI